jgi:hypothetical protein
MNVRVLILVVLVASAGFGGYRIGYSSGQDDARIRQAPAESQAEDPQMDESTPPADEAAEEQLELKSSACVRALGWVASELVSLEAMATRVKDALRRGDEATAEDEWNSFYHGRSLDEYYYRDFPDDAELCGLPQRYLRRI